MAYIAPIHRPSSVRHAIKLNLLDPDNECLVLAKANRIEIWEPTTEGLALRHSKAIHGCVSMFAKIRPPNATTDHLVIGTVRFRYFTVVWRPESQILETVQAFEDFTEKYIQESNSQDQLIVDPTGRYLILELYQGIISLIKVKTRLRRGATVSADDYLEIPEQIRIMEIKVRASTFLYTEEDKPKVAFLYEDARGKMKLSTYRVVGKSNEWSRFDPARDRENELDDLDLGANHLIPVPKPDVGGRRHVPRDEHRAKAHLSGVIIVGETMLTYLDDESKATVTQRLPKPAIFIAWVAYDDLNYLLADDYGMLYVLTIVAEGTLFLEMSIRELGNTSTASTMVYMGNGILFIGSHMGDSQVVAVNLQGQQPITVLQTMPNIAPIMDFAVMDMGNREGETQSNDYSSGQARLVTCSGAYQDGSLRSVRSGVGLEDIGILADMEDIQDMFSLRSSPKSTVDDTLVVSFPTESRVFKFDEAGQIEELDNFRGLALNGRILLAMSLPDGALLQVTSTFVSIIAFNPSQKVYNWHPPEGQIITAVSANEHHVLLAANGTALVSLDVRRNLEEVAAQTLQGDQVACINISSEISDVGVVGFWKSGSLSVLRLKDLHIIYSEDLRRSNDASVPRDVVLTQILPRDRFGPSLFVAMEDGIVLSFNVDSKTYALSGRKSIVLGTQQARFQTVPRSGEGLYNIFATCEHPSLIYGSEGNVVYSAVTAEDAVCVSSFNSEAYPDCLIVASSDTLKICQIDTERRTHVQTLPMRKTVRRIAYSQGEGAFAIGCINRQLIDGVEHVTSSLELAEEVLLGQTGKPWIFQDPDMQGVELIECVIRAELPVNHGGNVLEERFIVGTSCEGEDGVMNGAVKGRIMVFAVDKNKDFVLVHSTTLRGACRRVAVMPGGKIVAALVKTVVVYDYAEDTAVSANLQKLATYRASTVPIDIDVTGNIIAVADLMKSVTLIEYTAGKDGLQDELVEVGRHQETGWATGVSHIADNTYLETDHDGNIIILARQPGVTKELKFKKELEVTGEINLGEMVNKIRRINVEPSPNAIVLPKAFLATTEGSIFLLSLIPPQNLTLLTSLQNLIASHITTLGDIDFNSYRGFKNKEREALEPFRFIDGELIERYLDFGEVLQEDIARAVGVSAEGVRGTVEELRRMH